MGLWGVASCNTVLYAMHHVLIVSASGVHIAIMEGAKMSVTAGNVELSKEIFIEGSDVHCIILGL